MTTLNELLDDIYPPENESRYPDGEYCVGTWRINVFTGCMLYEDNLQEMLQYMANVSPYPEISISPEEAKIVFHALENYTHEKVLRLPDVPILELL